MLVKKSKKYFPLFFVIISCSFIFLLIFIKEFKTKKDKIIPVIVQKTNYKSIELILKEKHYKKIKKKRDKALTIGVLETRDEDFVPATVIFNSNEYKASVRLKGDWTDHLKGVKWSYRVKLAGDQTILGMRKFSIHHPSTRGYLNEWLYHKAIKQEGIMGLRYDFLEGFLHVTLKNADTATTRNVGIYALEETFDKRLIENNNRKTGVILKLTEDDMWKEVAKIQELSYNTGTHRRGKYNFKRFSTSSMHITAYSLSKVLADESLNKQFTLAKNLLIKLNQNGIKISKVFDVEKTAQYTAIANLFGCSHGLTTHNLRFYYNPITSFIEPIAFDGNSGLKLKEFKYYWKSSNDPIFIKALIVALEEISQPEYLDQLLDQYKAELNYLKIDMEKEFNNKPILSIDILKENQILLRAKLLELKDK